jgi:hypothetical protein
MTDVFADATQSSPAAGVVLELPLRMRLPLLGPISH